MEEIRIIDSHCHLNALDYEKIHTDVDDVIEKAKAQGVEKFISISCSLSEPEEIRNLVKHREEVFYSCGVHPLNIDDEPFDIEKLRNYLTDPKAVAIGEVGLDYYYSQENKQEQQEIFAQQIDLANEVKKPLIIHTRSARKDTIDLLRSHNAQDCRGVLHCFTEDYDMAKKALDLGFYIGVSGIFTFKNAVDLQEVMKKLPLERLLIETDSPYLAPVPYRGKQNQPAYVRNVCEFLAELKNKSVSDVARITRENTEQLFGI